MRLKKPYDPRVNGVSQSMLTTFMSCRQKAKLKLEGWRYIRPGAALILGTMAHEVIAQAFETLNAPPSQEWIKKALRHAVAKVEEEHNNRLSAEAVQKMEKSAAVLTVLLPLYFQYWKKDFGSKDWIKVESKFKVQIPGMPFPVMGYYDRVRRIQGKPWLFETKTKGKIEEDFLTEMLHFDFQNGLYLQSLMQELGEIPRGVVYDVLRNPGLKEKEGEAFEEYLKRVEKDVKKRPQHYFIRFEVAIDKKEIAEFTSELIKVGNEFELWMNGKLPTYKNTTACRTSYGACDMLPICARQDYSNFARRSGGRKGGSQ